MKKKMALLTPFYCRGEGIAQVTEEKALKFSKDNDVTVITFEYDNTIIPKGYKVLVLANKILNDLKEDVLIDGTLLKN